MRRQRGRRSVYEGATAVVRMARAAGQRAGSRNGLADPVHRAGPAGCRLTLRVRGRRGTLAAEAWRKLLIRNVLADKACSLHA